MKKLIALLIAASFAMPVLAEVKTKQVCRDKVVKGKTVQQCKTIKVHKKFEGTKVPTPAPKKPAAKQPAKKKQ
jgi:hypothetical protein